MGQRPVSPGWQVMLESKGEWAMPIFPEDTWGDLLVGARLVRSPAVAPPA